MATGKASASGGDIFFRELQTANYVSDLNDVGSDGRIHIAVWLGGTTSNSPQNDATYGVVIHLGADANYQMQIAATIASGSKIFIRNKYNGTWYAWKTFTAPSS